MIKNLTQIVTKLTKIQLWQNSVTYVLRKLKNPKCDQTPKLKYEKTKKNPIFTKLKKSKYDKTKNVTKLKNCDRTKKSNWH